MVTEREQELLAKFKPVLQAFLHDHLPLQVTAIYALQVFTYTNNFPKGMCTYKWMNEWMGRGGEHKGHLPSLVMLWTIYCKMNDKKCHEFEDIFYLLFIRYAVALVCEPVWPWDSRRGCLPDLERGSEPRLSRQRQSPLPSKYMVDFIV